MIMTKSFFHNTAEISDQSKIGKNCYVWNNVQIRENVKIGENCIFGKDVYIDKNVVIGNNVKIQNQVSIYDGVQIEDNVFIGPHTCFTNDKFPQVNQDWKIIKTLVKNNVSIGANCTILCGITLHEGSIIGAGSVVTKNTKSKCLYFGNPARKIKEVNY